MKNKIYRAFLEAEQEQMISLRASEGFGGVQVDHQAGVIRNCAVMTVGEAKGHGFFIDQTTLEQMRSILSATPDGVTSRFKHPPRGNDGNPVDALGTDVGKLKNVRIEGNSLRGDIYLAEYAKKLPIYGDVSGYLLEKADKDPSGIGLSPEIFFTLTDQKAARVVRCNAVDFVGKPASNPNGLLSEPNQPIKAPASAAAMISQPTNSGELNMDPTTTAAPAAPVVTATPEPVQTATLSAPVTNPANVTVSPAPAQSATAASNIVEQEKERCAQLHSLAAIYPGIPAEVVNAQIAANSNLEQARTAFLGYIAENNRPVTNVRTGGIVVGHDQGRTAYLAAIPDAILLRAGQKVENPHELTGKLRGQKMTDMFKILMVQLGAGFDEVMSINPADMASLIARSDIFAQRYPAMYAQLAQSTNSFSNLLTDAMGKTLRKAYMDTPTTWQEWCGRDTAPDFKSKKFIQLSDSPGLTAKPEGKEIVYSTFSDSKETATLATYASGIILTREAIINDDLSAFGRIPTSQGGAAKRLEDDTAYAVLTANANLADSIALFHASHSNLISATASIGAPTVTTVAATEALLLKQTGPKGAYLKLQARNMIVPVALKTVATKFVRSVTDPAATASGVVNPYYNAYNVIAEPRLDASSAVIWYLSADPGVIDTVTMVFLTDEPEPVLAQETKFDTLDAKFAVRHTIVAKAIDYRGLAKNPGA